MTEHRKRHHPRKSHSTKSTVKKELAKALRYVAKKMNHSRR